MGTITEKLYKILETKNDFYQRFVKAGIEIDDTTPFSKYPKLMENMGGGNIFVSNIQTEIAQEVSVTETIESSPCLINITDITASIE